jgi:hypothetical protein
MRDSRQKEAAHVFHIWAAAVREFVTAPILSILEERTTSLYN